jgi:hypothetical protein
MIKPKFFKICDLADYLMLREYIKQHRSLVEDYARTIPTEEKLKHFPPVKIYYDGKQYWLADGILHTAAAAFAGHTNVWAIVRRGTHGMTQWNFITSHAQRNAWLAEDEQCKSVQNTSSTHLSLQKVEQTPSIPQKKNSLILLLQQKLGEIPEQD